MKKKVFSMILLAISIATLLFGGYGCMKSYLQDKKKSVNDVALEYMEQKYGEKFEYVSPWGYRLSKTHELLVRCDSLPEQDILVQVENYKTVDRVFRDNYLAVKYKEETIAFFLRSATDVFGDANVFYKVAKMSLSPELSVNATFDEYFSDPCGFISACIEIKVSSFSDKEQVQKVIDSITTDYKGEHLALLIVFVDDELFGTYNEDTLRESVVRRQFVRCARVTGRNSDVQTEWLGG